MVLFRRFILLVSLALCITSCSITGFLTRQDEESHSGQTPLVLRNGIKKNTALPEFGEEALLGAEHFVLKYKPVAEVISLKEEGRASWYGPNFQGRLTANGERYNMHKMTAAHPSLPFNTHLWVENKANGQAVMVRVNDRGPYANDRILDLSREAAEKLNMIGKGTANVRLYVIKNEIDSQGFKSDPFTIQLGIFNHGDDAFKLASKISNTRVEIIEYEDGTKFGVFYGFYKDKRQAFIVQRKLEQQNLNGFVMQRGSS